MPSVLPLFAKILRCMLDGVPFWYQKLQKFPTKKLTVFPPSLQITDWNWKRANLDSTQTMMQIPQLISGLAMQSQSV